MIKKILVAIPVVFLFLNPAYAATLFVNPLADGTIPDAPFNYNLNGNCTFACNSPGEFMADNFVLSNQSIVEGFTFTAIRTGDSPELDFTTTVNWQIYGFDTSWDNSGASNTSLGTLLYSGSEIASQINVANPTGSPHDADNEYTWTSLDDSNEMNPDGTVFTEFLASLNNGTPLAGYTNWRLPTLTELKTILHEPEPCSSPFSINACVVDPLFWPASEYRHWTSTEWVIDPASISVITFSHGYIGANVKYGNANVRAVRNVQ